MPKRESREETSWGVRLLASGIGMFWYDSSFAPAQVAELLLDQLGLVLGERDRGVGEDHDAGAAVGLCDDPVGADLGDVLDSWW